MKREKPLNDTLSDRDLAGQVAALVEFGHLDQGHPAYGVALAAIDLGYDRLTRAQKGLYDRVVVPALAALASGAAAPARVAPATATATMAPPATAQASREVADGGNRWRPIREAPDDRAVQLATMVDGKPSALAFARRQVQRNWVNADTGKAVYVRPSHWREWAGG